MDRSINEKMDGRTYRPTICVPMFLSIYQEYFYILFWKHLKILITIKDNTLLKQISAFSE